MSFISRWFGRPPGPPPMQPGVIESRASGAYVPQNQYGKPVYLPRDPLIYQTEGHEKLALMFRCVLQTATSAAEAPVRVYADAAGRRQPIDNHPMRALMIRPNPQQRENAFWSQVVTTACVSGFCVVEKYRTAPIAGMPGRVIALYPLRPDWLRPVPREDGFFDWLYYVPGQSKPERLRAEDAMVFTYADRGARSPIGLGPIEVVLREVGLQNRMTDFLKSFFDAGAMPVYGLVPELIAGKRMNQQDVDDLKHGWTKHHSGLHNAADPAVLQNVKDVKRLSFDFNELAWLDLRDLNDLAICQAFGIHPAMMFARIGLEHSDSRANSAEARKGFYQDVISPLLARFDDVLTLGLLEEFSSNPLESLEFDKTNIAALADDRNEKAKWVVPLAVGGVITAHTLHRELNLEMPAGDDFYLRPISIEAIPASTPLGAPAPKPTAGKPPALTPGNTRDAIAAVSVREIRQHLSPIERRAAAGATNRALIGRVADRLVPAVETFLQMQGERIADAYHGIRAAELAEFAERRGADDIAEYMPSSRGFYWRRVDDAVPRAEVRMADPVDWQSEDAALAELIARIYHLAAETSYRAAADQLGIEIDFNLSRPELRAVLESLGLRIVDIADTTRRTVAEVVTRALEEGNGLAEIADRIREHVTETYPNRALTIARTESQVSYNLAGATAYAATGIVDEVELLDNPHHTEDPGSDGLTCAERNHLVVKLAAVETHVLAEHPNGSLSMAPIVRGEG